MTILQPHRPDAKPARNRLYIGPVLIDPPLLQAPMAGFTDHAFRRIVRHYGGVGLPATEMVSARSFIELDARQGDVPERLWGVKEEPRPLAVQIWDNDPGALAAVGARLAEEFGVSVIDLNFGCPVKQISENAMSGSYLLRDPDRVGAIVARVAAACRPTPVTAKIRLGLTAETINAVEVARAIESAGGAAVTVHGRTAGQMFRGQADWERIAEIKPHLKRIPLIGNGDLKSARSAVEALDRYAVDGVMIGRAMLNKPWLFRQARAQLAGEPIPPDPSFDEQRRTLLDHYRQIADRFGAKKGTMLMRRYGARYAQGGPGARAFRTHVATVVTPAEFFDLVEKYFPRDGVAGE
jgi:tRNA-dihydrouridine synthase B